MSSSMHTTPRVPRTRVRFIIGGGAVGLVLGGGLAAVTHQLAFTGAGLVLGAALGGLASLMAHGRTPS